MKYEELAFFVEVNKFNSVREMLKGEFGLVAPRDDPYGRGEKDKLVWEDAEGNGRYRVDFMEDREVIFFRYWGATITPELEREDPMLPAIRRTYEITKPVRRCAQASAGIIFRDVAGSP
jgi:hypothetical protein